MLKDHEENVITLFSPSSTVQTPRRASRVEDGYFASHKSHSSRGSISDFAKMTGTATPNESHSPVWGRTSFLNQPELRAEEPPSASISAVINPPQQRNWRPEIGSKDARATSQERHALKTAEWSITYGEQGNGGLRNAVYAATKSGSLKEKTWVR